jgi:predicted ATP-dependent endonuclease of OLD family
MFVSIPNVNEIRFVRRVNCDEHEFKQCKLKALDLGIIARQLEAALQKSVGTFTVASLAPRLHILGTELAEGFFADAVVLVEGRSDKAALIAAASLLNVNFESAGIAVLSVEGKGNIDRPLLIFRELDIPTYPIWDCDTNKSPGEAHPEQNLLLVRAANPTANHQIAPTNTLVNDLYAHFSESLERTLEAELTKAVFDESLKSSCAKFDSPVGRDAQKSPEIMKALLLHAHSKGRSSPTLEAIVRTIWKMLKKVELP